MEKYQAEQKELSEDVSKLEAKLSAVKQDKDDVEEFTADRPRDIHIYYKLLDKPLLNKLRLDTAKIEKPLD